VEHCKRIDDFTFVSRGSKIAFPVEDESETPSGRTEEYMDNFQNLLNLERVILTNKVSKAIYDGTRVRVVSTVGKWIHGYHEDAVNYLRPHEALFLMEMCKLEVTFDSVPMSIEQGYAIFLDPSGEVPFEDYLVYSYLSRAGYFVYTHRFEKDREKYEAAEARVLDKEDEMIFCVLMEKLNQPVTESFVKQESELYEKTKTCMEVLCEQISGKRGDVPGTSRIKTAVEEPPVKRQKTETKVVEDRSFIDILKNETEYSTYEHIFESFSFIKRAENFEESEGKLKFTFDIFLPKMHFKRTEDLPNYRVLVVK
jgi:tRNA-splicing endonuclease subunit Sen54